MDTRDPSNEDPDSVIEPRLLKRKFDVLDSNPSDANAPDSTTADSKTPESDAPESNSSDSSNSEPAIPGFRYIATDIDEEGSDIDPDASESEIDSEECDSNDDLAPIAQKPIPLESGRGAYGAHLWRVFSPESFGYNTKEAIIPLKFLRPLTGPSKPVPPVSSLNLRRIQYMLYIHVRSSYSSIRRGSRFSSWSPLLETSLGHAMTGKSTDISVAILDPACVEEHVEMFLCRDLYYSGYVHSEHNDEWLVYGPIMGPAYYTASVHDLKEQGLDDILTEAQGPEVWCGTRAIRTTSTSEVLTAYKIACVFNFDGVRGMELLVVTTIDLVCIAIDRGNGIVHHDDYCDTDHPNQSFSNYNVEAVCSMLSDTLQAEIAYLAKAVKNGHQLRLLPTDAQALANLQILGHTRLMERLLRSMQLKIKRKAGVDKSHKTWKGPVVS